MAYKDKDKQREANRQAQARFKAKGITNQGITKQDMEGITGRVLPKDVPAHGLTAGFENTVFVKPERTAQGNIRVSKPGDVDYEPQCETTRAFIEGVTDESITFVTPEGKSVTFTEGEDDPDSPKRGKDIKCFEDLPPDVQDRISRMKTGVRFKEIETNRAIKYEQFITAGKPGDADYNGVCTEAWRAERGR